MLFCHFRSDSFRCDYARLGEVRSLILNQVRVMALTATATKPTREVVISRLCMQETCVVYLPPTKNNIIIVRKKEVLSDVQLVLNCLTLLPRTAYKYALMNNS